MPFFCFCRKTESQVLEELAENRLKIRVIKMETEKVDQILKNRKGSSYELIEILQDVQKAYNYLPEGVLRVVAKRVEVPLIEVFRVANFYKSFTLSPRGRYLLTICTGTACHIRGSSRFLKEALRELNLSSGETTTDGMFTVETVNCLGACALGPVVVLNGKYYERMTAKKLRDLIRDIRRQNKGK